LITRETLDKYDKSGMYKTYDKWPGIAREVHELDLEPVDFEGIDHVVFAGMGGSGALGDIFSSILSKSNIHVSIVKGYLLPKTVDSETIVIATSASGNTIETSTVLRSALELNCTSVAFSSGGTMEDFCIKNNISHRRVPLFQNPRTSLPSYVYSLLSALKPVLPISPGGIEESIRNLEDVSKKISSTNLSVSNPALSLAQWMLGIPMILYPRGLQPAAIRFKNSIQENTKCHAMTEDILEFCHNGIVAYETESDVKPVLLRGVDDYVKTRERWSVVKDFFEQHRLDYWEVVSPPGNILTKIISMIYLLDYATIYRAALSKTDPHPVRSIDYVKEKL